MAWKPLPKGEGIGDEVWEMMGIGSCKHYRKDFGLYSRWEGKSLKGVEQRSRYYMICFNRITVN